MTTTQKHRSFIGEPMGEKLISDIAGMGAVYSGRLEEKGFIKVLILYIMFWNGLLFFKSIQYNLKGVHSTRTVFASQKKWETFHQMAQRKFRRQYASCKIVF